jgi:hypothetical protein
MLLHHTSQRGSKLLHLHLLPEGQLREQEEHPSWTQDALHHTQVPGRLLPERTPMKRKDLIEALLFDLLIPVPAGAECSILGTSLGMACITRLHT